LSAVVGWAKALYHRADADKEQTVTKPEKPADMPAEAERALAEAEERRKKASPKNTSPELGGRDGPEPVRFGDWERKGIAVDF